MRAMNPGNQLIANIGGTSGFVQIAWSFRVSPGREICDAGSAEIGGRRGVIGAGVRYLWKIIRILPGNRSISLIAVDIAHGKVTQQRWREDVIPVETADPSVLGIGGTRRAELNGKSALLVGLGLLPP